MSVILNIRLFLFINQTILWQYIKPLNNNESDINNPMFITNVSRETLENLIKLSK